MDYPKISIVTPVFNQAKYLEETIQSILVQGYPNLEYIIIDGGSSDGTVDIIRKYESQLAYWISEPDKGMYDALQKGFDYSTGEIMGWLNADDIYIGKSLFVIAKVFQERSTINWITSHHAVIDEEDRLIFVKPTRQYCKYHFYLSSKDWQGDEIGQEQTFWKRCLWEESGSKMAKHLKLAGDYELWLRFFQTDTLYVVNTIFAAFRTRNGQLSSNIEQYYKEAQIANDSLPLDSSGKRICQKYETRIRISKLIDKTRIFNGRKVCRIKGFENKYFQIPPIISV
jgi:glycosyltransferase involved in cell wall biosynthesis